MAITPEDVSDLNEELDRRPYSRRHDDHVSDPWLTGVPSWVKAIAAIGIPGVIALFLVWQGAKQLPKIEERQVAIEKSMIQTQEAIRQQAARMDQMYRMLQRICSNTAKSEDDRQRCFD